MERNNTGDFQTDVMVTLERLETHIESLVGNGQPGRIKLIEDKQEEHSSRLNLLWGGLILLGVLAASSIGAVAFDYFSKH
jgi:hypothetical protein